MTTVSSASGNSAAYQAYKSEMFRRRDTDGNGSLSKEESAAGRPSETTSKPRSAAVGASDSTSATSSSPESFLSGDAMAILMMMRQQGGFSFEGGGSGGDPSSAYMSAQMDADGDGSITQAEFVSSRPEDVSEEDATALFASIDSEGKGALTAEELDAGMKASAPPPPGGAPAGASSGETEEETFDSMDTNKDGVVSQDEFLAYNPGAAAEETGTEKSVKVESSSIKGKLLDELMERLSATRASIEQGLASEAEKVAKADGLSDSATADASIAIA